MENLDLTRLCEEVKIIAVRAGKIIMEVYDHTDFFIEEKTDQSPLTLADKKSNDVICASLMNVNPHLPIISEENKSIPYETRRSYHHYWLVDPLDGTKEFIKRNGEFTVNIALVSQHEVVMGVVYCPVSMELYYGIRNPGSWVEKHGHKSQLAVNTFSMQDPWLRVVCSRSHLNEETQAYIDQLIQPEKVSRGSSLKFLILAEGNADLYPRLAPTMEWDTAAAQIILEEAGGKVVRADNGEILRYNKKNMLNPKFHATGRVV